MKPSGGKVLLLTQYLHMGGLERMVLGLSTELKSGGEWEPQVVAIDRFPGAAPENDLAPAFAAAGVPASVTPKPRGFSPRLVLALRRKLAAEEIGVLHTHDLGPLIYGACAKLLSPGRVRLVHTQHSFFDLSGRWIDKYYHRFFARFADEIVAVSENIRRTYADLGVPSDRITVVPNGVRFPERSANRERSRADLLASLDGPPRAALESHRKARWILYMARIHSAKGQERALELWTRLSPRARAVSALLFVGPESEAGAMERLRAGMAAAPDCERILVMGAARFPERWIAAADLALSCSPFEGMPLGPVEAAGAGLPLVLSRIPGHAALADWSAQYPLDDPAQGASKIENIFAQIDAGAQDFFDRTWEKGRTLRERYTLVRMSADYSRLYRP